MVGEGNGIDVIALHNASTLGSNRGETSLQRLTLRVFSCVQQPWRSLSRNATTQYYKHTSVLRSSAYKERVNPDECVSTFESHYGRLY